MVTFKRKTIGAGVGAVAGTLIGTGVLQGFGIDAGTVAKDVAIVVSEGLLGCAAVPSNVCAAGGRLIEVAALVAIATLCACVGHLVAPRDPIEPAPSSPPAA